MQAAADNNLEQLTFEEWRNIMALNMDSVFLGCKAALPAESRWQWFNYQYFVNQRQSCVGDVLWLLLRQSRYDDVQQVCSPTFLGDECGRQMQHCSPGPNRNTKL